MEYKIKAVVLSSYEIKEYDRIYGVFSRQKGRLKIIAKGVRRPKAKLAGCLEPITLSEIFLVKGRMMDKVIGAIAIDQYEKIKKDFSVILFCRKIFNLIENLLAEKDVCEELFDELIYFLENIFFLNENKQRIFYLALIWKIIERAGYQIQTRVCDCCGEKFVLGEKFWFVFPERIVCDVCKGKSGFSKKGISENSIKLLRIFSRENLKIISKLLVEKKDLAEISFVTKIFLENILGKKVSI